MADLWHVVEATSGATEEDFFPALSRALAEVASATMVLLLAAESDKARVLAMFAAAGPVAEIGEELSLRDTTLETLLEKPGVARAPAPPSVGRYAARVGDRLVAASAEAGPARKVLVCVVGSPAGVDGISDRALASFAARTAAELRAAERDSKRGALARERYRLVAEAVGEVIWELDLETEMIEWHGPMGARFKYPNITVASMAWWESKVHSDDRARVIASFVAALDGREAMWCGEYRFFRGDGTMARVRDRAFITRDESGRAIRAAGAMYDVSDQYELEQRLAVADRMASIGTLAAGLAHEINNPLTYVLGNLEIGLANLETARAAPDVIEALREARQGATRVAEIIRSMRVFGRIDTSASKSSDVDRVVESALRMAKNEIRHRARLKLELGGPPLAAANETTLVQVVLNLIVNAAQAIPEGQIDRYEIAVATGVEPNGRVFIEVRDTGHGMTPETMRRIFDPFFTTKAVGQGMGLGLSLVHSAVTTAGGEITVESTLGKGSVFRVRLLESSQQVTARTSIMVPVGERRRLLVVDDEAPVIRLFRRMLTADHEIVVAASGREALELLRDDGAFDAVLCDVMMPDLTGADVHREIARRSPALAARFVFVTGGAFGERARAYVDATDQPTVSKPFNRSHILRAIDAAVIKGRDAEMPSLARAG
ncbi:MAG TPA: ATP-binding protein [Labilithrix sp.]|nr:ATP-binding protein [Labilithrix sp.]